jgi:hypothetical protein
VWSLERVSKSHHLLIAHYLRERATFSMHDDLYGYDNDNNDDNNGENSDDDDNSDYDMTVILKLIMMVVRF